ncbi:uncharacterized protein RSE6_03302 [Rhynchosporium secalis]|uniref:Ubiquitin-like domain-containing protein n=1 Tax=Rhynchosporium secalis TaxID=38038 RepID=A0A1E1M2F5_RHYSE|nr:uncharacterized protein RSE6_03302 [Rhynchosporium secalis]
MEIYHDMLSSNAAAVVFLFSLAFTLPLQLMIEAEDLDSKFGLGVEEMIEEFRRFLAIKLFTVDKNATKISPTPLMDELWHVTILNTCFYAELKDGLAATLHHRPSGASLDARETQNRERRLIAMRGIYKAFLSMGLLAPLFKDGLGISPPAFTGTPIHVARGQGIQIFIGSSNTHLTIDVYSNSVVDDLKATIHERTGFVSGQMRLIFAGKQLEEGRTLSDYNIRNASTIHIDEVKGMLSFVFYPFEPAI